MEPRYKTIEDVIGHTPLVRLTRLPGAENERRGNVILVKLDRPDPSISRWAGYTAAPTFAQVARRLFYYYNIPPDNIRLGAENAEQS